MKVSKAMKWDILRLGSSQRALMPGLLLASCAALGQAQAACTPDAPVNNGTVTCTGTTSGGAIGYGTAGDTGNTYNIVSGAIVTGTNSGLLLKDGKIDNSGRIEATVGSIGIDAENVDVTNRAGGVISGPGSGINAATLKLDNDGRIEVSTTGGFAIDVRSADVINRSGGTISGGEFGIRAGITLTLDNSGKVEVEGKRDR